MNETGENIENKVKSNFVPSYNRKNETNNNQNDNKGNKRKKKKIFKSKTPVILLAVIVLILVLVFVFRNNGIIKSNYDELMEDYGLVTLYDNGLSNGNESVTKAEAIKMILAVTLNIDNIDYYVSSDVQEEYPNSKWVYYANAIGVISESDITKDNYNEVEEYRNTIRYLANAKVKILSKTLDTSKDPSFTDFNKYTPDEKWAISDMVYNGVIEDKKSSLDADKNLNKSDMNRMIIEYALKYNLITVNGEKININKDKMPSNADEFPYTLATIDKSVYEIQNYVADQKKYKNPRKSFREVKNKYKRFDTIINEYFNTLLNINYENLDKEKMLQTLNDTTLYYIDTQMCEDYINFVTSNKIKMSGEIKVQYPIIYFDGENYRVRAKLTLNVESTDTLSNLFLGDKEATYKIGKNEKYIDIPLMYSEVNENYFISFRSLKHMESGKVYEEPKQEEQLSEEMQELIQWQENLTQEDLDNAIEV